MSVPLSLTTFKLWFYPSLLSCISSIIPYSRLNSLNLCLACIALFVCVGGCKCACLLINTTDNNHSVSSIVSMSMHQYTETCSPWGKDLHPSWFGFLDQNKQLEAHVQLQRQRMDKRQSVIYVVFKVRLSAASWKRPDQRINILKGTRRNISSLRDPSKVYHDG